MSRALRRGRVLRLLVAAFAASMAVALAAGGAGAAAAAGTGHKGVVQSISSTSLTIATAKGTTYTFALGAGTTFKKLDETIGAAGVKPGASVDVTFSASGAALTATEVVVGLVTPAGTFFTTKVKGVAGPIAADRLTVTTAKGKTVVLRLGANVSVDRLGAKAGPADIKQGNSVKVRYTIAADGTLSATDIAIGVQSAAGILYADVEKGTIASAAPGRLELETGQPPALPLALGPATKIRRLGVTVPVSALVPGTRAKVRFHITPAGSLAADAVDIGVSSVAGTLYSDTKTGSAKSVSATSLALTTEKGETLTFRIGHGTSFKRDGLAAPRGTVHAGDALRVKLGVLPGGTLLADRIEAGRKLGRKLVFAEKQKGTIVTANHHRLVIRTAKGHRLTLRLGRMAAFEVAGVPAREADLATGDEAKIKFLPLGVNQVVSVHVIPGDSGFRLDGKVVATRRGALVVRVRALKERGARKVAMSGKSVAVVVPATARIRTRGRVVPVRGLRIGRSVHVVGRLVGSRLVARHVVS